MLSFFLSADARAARVGPKYYTTAATTLSRENSKKNFAQISIPKFGYFDLLTFICWCAIIKTMKER